MLPQGKSFETQVTMVSLNYLQSRYIGWQWDGKAVDGSNVTSLRTRLPLLLGYVPVGGGEFTPPYVEPDSGVSNLLAFVVHQNMKRGFPVENVPPHELAFLLLNGTAEPLDAQPPLSAGSILYLSAPGIGYSTNIVVDSNGFESKTIPAGECGQWRIPFEKILAQIPKETVEAIRADDGKLDLVWKTGDIESQMLPLILLPPTQGELDAKFLAEHADVPRIDQNTDLSLDLRLAGIEGNKPVLLGTMRNNEKHAVLWAADRKSIQYNNVSPSCLFGNTFYFNRLGYRLGYGNVNYGGRPHIVDSKERVEMLIPLDRYAAGQQRRVAERTSGFMMAGRWEFFDRVIGAIWLGLPGDKNGIGKIHAFDAQWHKLTTFDIHQGKGPLAMSGVPALPMVAPLLAYVYKADSPSELTCVLWNRTEEAVQLKASRIIVTNAALGYRREIALPAGLDLPATVAPGTHTDWRVPWSAIVKQIPSRDLARIKAADGKLDLIWQANDLASPALPLLLGWQGDAE
jgi:hypothetical protein